MRKLSGKSGPITLSTKGVSDTAVSLSRKTLRETQEGFARLLNPDDSTITLQRMKGISPLRSSSQLLSQQVFSRRPIQELQTIREEVLPPSPPTGG